MDISDYRRETTHIGSNQLLQKLSFLGMFFVIMFVPIDGIGIFADLPLYKVAGLLTFGLIVLLLLDGADVQGFSWFMALTALYVVWVIFSFLWTMMPVDYESTQAINSQQTIKVHLYLIVNLFLLFQVVKSNHDLQWVMLAFLIGLSLLMLLFLQDLNTSGNAVRQQIKELDANEMAVKLALGITLAFYLLIFSRLAWIRMISLLFLPCAMLAIVATGSRTGFVVLLLSLIAAIPLLQRAGWFIRLASLAMLILAAVLVVNTIPERTLERILSTRSELSQGTLNERSITWRKAYLEWEEKPLFGHGLSSFRYVMNRHNVEYTAHNSYISIAVEQGLVGLLLYLAVLAVLAAYCFALPPPQRLLLLSLLLVATAGQMTLTLQSQMYIWFAYGLIALAYKVNARFSAKAV